MWPFSKPKSYLGIDIGAGGIKVVELHQEKNRPVLFTYGYTSEDRNVHKLLKPTDKKIPNKTIGVPTEYNEEEISGTISNEHLEKYSQDIIGICKQARTTAKTAVVSLPVSAVFHALVTLPMVKKEDLNSILKAEITKLLPRPVEEMALDYQVLASGAEDKSQKVLVNAVPRDLVDFYARVFQKSGLILDSLEPESAALSRSLVGKDNSVSMVIDMGAERTNFFIIDQGVPVTHHSIETGGNKINSILQNILGVDEKMTEQIKFDLSKFLSPAQYNAKGNLLDIFMPVVDPIDKEIEYSFDLFLRQSGNESKSPEKIILTGGASFLPYLSQYIADKFKMKCYIGDPWARVVHQDSLGPLLHEIGPRMSVAIGLALRNMLN